MPKVRPKVRGKKEVYDEYDYADIDRDEQLRGMKRREYRWKLAELRRKKELELTKKVVNEIEEIQKMKKVPRPLFEAWLRCDYVLWNIMEDRAYNLMEHLRKYDTEAYKSLYKIFMSPNMMEHIQYFVDYFAKGGKVYDKKISHETVLKRYKNYKYMKIHNNDI